MDIKCEDCIVKEKCIFSALSKEQKLIMNSKKLYLAKKKSTTLYHEGDHASTLFMVREGLLKHVRGSGADEQVFIEYAKSNDLSGLASLKQNGTYQTSLISLTDVSYCAFPNHLLYSFAVNNFKLSEYFAESFMNYVSRAGQKIFDLVKCPAFNRLAKTLVFISHYLPLNKNGFEIKREELAELNNMTRETVSRQLAKMKREKLIAIKDHHIRILQPAKLEALSKCK